MLSLYPVGGIFGLIQTATAALLLFFMQPGLYRRNNYESKWIPPLVGLAFALSAITVVEGPIIDAFHALVGGWIFDIGLFRICATLFALAVWFAPDRKLNLWLNTMGFSALLISQIIWLGPIMGPVNVPQFVVDHSSPVLIRKMWNDLPKAPPI